MDTGEITSPSPLSQNEAFPTSPDPLTQTDIFAPPNVRNTRPIASVLPRKRPATSKDPPRPFPNPTTFNFSNNTTILNPTIHTVPEAFELVRNVLIQASNIAASRDEQTKLLDLLEVFRDFTEAGRVKRPETAILATQIQKLESVSKTFSKTINNQPKSTQIPLQQTQNKGPAVPAQQQNTPPISYATAAAKGAPKSTDWTTVASKKKAQTTKTPKTSLNSRQLVLIQDLPNKTDPLVLRNSINRAFANKGVTAPVVASATRSRQENTVLTTTPSFDAKYLVENMDIWKSVVAFQEALPITPWHKVAIHNIPTSLENLAILKDEISLFNNGLQVVGEPYWLSHEDKRKEKLAGSVCIAFKNQKDADYAIRNRLFLLGISVRADKLHSTPPSTQCQKCQRFGHVEARCRNDYACKICSEPHATQQHKCNIGTCNTKGKVCIHSVRKCANCSKAHTADDKQCESYQGTRNPRDLNASIHMEC
jgi:hypothetical protein